MAALDGTWRYVAVCGGGIFLFGGTWRSGHCKFGVSGPVSGGWWQCRQRSLKHGANVHQALANVIGQLPAGLVLVLACQVSAAAQ